MRAARRGVVGCVLPVHGMAVFSVLLFEFIDSIVFEYFKKAVDTADITIAFCVGCIVDIVH